MAFSPRIDDGAAAMIQEPGASQLARAPFFESAFALLSSSWELRLPNTKAFDVTLLNGSQTFATTFAVNHLDQAGGFKPTRSLYDLLGQQMFGEARLGVSRGVYDSLAPMLKGHLTYDEASFPVFISKDILDLPAGLPLFQEAVFTSDPLPKVNLNGLRRIPSLQLFVLVKEGQDMTQAAESLRAFAKEATAAQPYSKLVVNSISELMLEQQGGTVAKFWNANQELCSLILALVIAAAVLGPFVRIGLHEGQVQILNGAEVSTALKRKVAPVLRASCLSALAAAVLGALLAAHLGSFVPLASGVSGLFAGELVVCALVWIICRQKLRAFEFAV